MPTELQFSQPFIRWPHPIYTFMELGNFFSNALTAIISHFLYNANLMRSRATRAWSDGAFLVIIFYIPKQGRQRDPFIIEGTGAIVHLLIFSCGTTHPAPPHVEFCKIRADFNWREHYNYFRVVKHKRKGGLCSVLLNRLAHHAYNQLTVSLYSLSTKYVRMCQLIIKFVVSICLCSCRAESTWHNLINIEKRKVSHTTHILPAQQQPKLS